MTKYKNVIWDWNGTLLNDVSACVQSMNMLLKERSLPEINEQIYKEVFTFPVKDYYEKIGFDFTREKFDGPALKFIEYFHLNLPSVQLFSDAKTILNHFHNQGKNQVILSAMEQFTLEQSVKNLRISKYFNKIVGLDDHFARSKTEQGKYLIESKQFIRNETIMIGDTLHDKEVAESMGVDCILVAQGHQSMRRLQINGNKVFSNLLDLKNIL